MNKLFTLLLALMTTTALWAHDFYINGIYYNILTDKTNEVEVTYGGDNSNSYSNEYFGSVTIPETVTYNGTTYSVTSIGDDAFLNCSSLTSIIIPNSVTSIGESAFWRCSGLTSVTIPNSVKSIGGSVFYHCSGLTSVTIPNSVTSIRESVFGNCSGLTSIIIPNSVTSIGKSAFGNCSGLTSIIIPNSVTSIGKSAFYHCSGLTSVTIPNSVTSIGESAFRNCYNLKKIYLEPTTPPSLGNNVFDSKPEAYVHWSSLEVYADSEWKDYVSEFKVFIHYSGVLDNGITWKYDNGKLLISGNGALIYQLAPWIPLIDSIQSIEMINGITSISESAFANYKKLTKVTLPASLEEIGANAFDNCPRLYEIYSYASLPPIAQQSSFYNYNADVYVPCEGLSFYEKDMVFYLFPNLQCISSDEVPTDDVVINTGSTDVTITWPTEENADTYSIVIKKDGKVVCTLTFNSNGQLLNIAFAPGREGNHPAQYAEATANGYRFTVTGLDEGTKYAYNLDVNDNSGKTIKSYEGEFTTESTTALDNINSQSPMINVQKIIRNGQLLIIRDGKTYNAQGVEL